MKKMKIGNYEPVTQKKGINEAFVKGIKEGEVYWRIQIDKHGQMDVKTQTEAETISRLIRKERQLARKNIDRTAIQDEILDLKYKQPKNNNEKVWNAALTQALNCFHGWK